MVKTNGQAWDIAPNFVTPGDGMGDFGVAKFQTHPLSATLIQVQNLTYPREVKSDKNTANAQQVRFFKLYFDFNVFSAENGRLFSIEFQLHTNSHITLWLPVVQHSFCSRTKKKKEKKRLIRLGSEPKSIKRRKMSSHMVKTLWPNQFNMFFRGAGMAQW